MGTIKRMFQLSLTKREVVRSKRFMAILMIPIFIIQMSSLNLFLLKVAIAEDGENVEASKIELADDPPKDDEEKEKVESKVSEIETTKEEPEIKEIEIDKEEILPSVDELAKDDEVPSASADLILDDSLPIVGDKKDSDNPHEESSKSDDEEEKKITPEAAYDENLEEPIDNQAPILIEEKGWKKNADGSETLVVEVGNEYEYKNSGLKIKFTRIDNEAGEITVKEIELTPEQVSKLGALSNKAWDITSNMTDGTFEYELTLPVAENIDESKMQLVYVEEREDLNNEGKIKTVDSEDLKVDKEKDELVANGLNHFTVFILKSAESKKTSPVLSNSLTSGSGCILDVTDDYDDLNCTSNDIELAGPSATIIDGCDYPGDTANFDLYVDVNNNASERYDVGVWISTDGDPNHDGSYSGTCSVANLPILSPGFNLDFDGCGDVEATSSTPDINNAFIGNITLPCSDVDQNGQLDVPIVTSWSNSSNKICNLPQDTVPETKAKCKTKLDFNIPVPVPGQIIIKKETTPNSSTQEFNFNLSGNSIGNFDGSEDFSLSDGEVWDSGLVISGGLMSGSYNVTESPVNNWDLTNAICSSSRGTSTFSSILNGKQISLTPGDVVTCTFNNTQKTGSIIVDKVTNPPGDSQSFNFTTTGAGYNGFSLTDATAPNKQTVVAGTYSITEDLVSGWVQSSAVCSSSIGDSETIGLLELDPGEDITCVFTNTKKSKLTVIKNIINNNGGIKTVDDFGISFSGGALNFDGGVISGTNQKTYTSQTLTLDSGNYTLSENDIEGYIEGSWDCGTTSNGGKTAAINLVAGQNLVCAITNDDQPGTLIVKKEVTNDNGGNNVCKDFSFNYGTGAISFEEDCQNEISVPAGLYNVTEAPFNGYETTYDNCSNINIPNGGSATCTIKNNDNAPNLTVIKKVINDNGGDETVDAFEIKMNDNLLSFGAGVLNGETTTYTSNPTVSANTLYTLSEKDVDGYVEGTWSCKTVTGAPVAHPLALDEGQNVICEITNDDVAPSITLIKEVVNNNGGTAGVNSFGLSIGGTAVSSGQVYPVKANTAYALNEAGLNGYEFVSISGEGCPVNLGESVILNEGENITCTIKNDDEAGKLTVIKIVDNKFGGDLKSEDFTINVSGVNPSQTGFPGSSTGTLVTLDAGSYNVTENLIDGYVPKYSSDCSGIINIGDNKVCTITNEDQAPKLTLIKTVINNNGGTKQVSDFPLFIGSTQVASGVAVTLESNVEYTVSETSLAGYAPSVWSGACSADGKITLKPGDNKICYITNDDIQPKLIVTKIVNNSNYGNLTVADFPLYVGGMQVISGEQNGFNAGNYIVSEINKPGYSAVISGDCSANGGVTLNSGDVKSCTITNTDDLGKIIIEKQTLPDGDSKLFTFSGSVSGSIADGGTLEKIVAPGNYNVSEIVPSGWDLTSLVCDDLSSGGNVATGSTANINVEDNETVKCTFTNTKRSGITIVKNAINNNAQDFEFTNNFSNSNPTTFYLDDDGNATLPNTKTFEVLPGEYAVSETPVPGWQQESATCDNGDTIDSINVEPGENVTCTFINEEYAKIILVKNTIGGDDTFEFDATGSGLPSEIKLTALGGTATQTFSGLDQDNEYSIEEESLPDWNLTSAVCTGGNTPDKITPEPGETVTCTFTNTKDANITIIKKVVNDNGGTKTVNDFGINFSGGNLNFDAGVPSGNVTTYTSETLIVDPGNYTLSESDVTGYTEGTWDCGIVGAGGISTSLSLAPGEDKTCTITNDDQQAYITVNKVVINDNGGNAKSDDFLLTLEGNSVKSGVAVPVDPGTYTAGETEISGYAFVEFRGDCNANGDVTVALGETKTCTLVNDDVAPKLTLIKSVDNGNGGNALPDDFQLTIGGNHAISGTTYSLSANIPYAINETQLDGYEFVSITGDSKCPAILGGTITLDEGDDITCIIANNDIAPNLTIIKKVINDNGGNETVDAFEIKMNDNLLSFGAGVLNGETTTYTSNPTVSANTLYTLSEKDVDGYVEGTWSCKTVTGAPVSHPLTLDEGQNVICEITNDDVAPSITLIKEVIGGSATSDSFGLTIGGVNVNSGVATLVKANEAVALNEAGLAGYTFTSLGGDEGCPNILGGTVTLEEGEDITCKITNTRDLGSITVNKIIDMDGDLETAEDQMSGVNWQFDVGGTSLDTSDPVANITDANGSVVFENLKTGEYTIIETKQDGYDLVSASCGLENGVFDQIDSVDDVLVTKEGNTICNFYNVPNGTIHGYKWEDLNGSRERDCEFNERVANGFSSNILCEGENLLSGWTINLYRGIGDGLFETDPYKTMQTSDSEEHFGWYWFEHLLPGEYKVCEVLQKGWSQTYPNGDGENCHIITLPDGNSNGFNESQNAVWGPEYNFGNQFINPELTILKYNSQWPNIQSPGSIIDYTIKVEASENDVNDVIVTDLPPEGFEYVSGSWSASSSLGEGHIGNLKLDHIYASPGVWDLGDMQSGEVITLSYKAQIEGAQQPGTYNDLAWADGTDDRSQRVLAGSVQAPTVDDGVISDNFVGTQIALVITPNPQNVELEEEEKTETKTKKRVLGVTTYLPSTGTPNFWLILGVLALALGTGLILISRRRINNSKNMLNKIVIVFILGAGIALGSGINEANAQVAPAIRLAQPDTPTNIKNQEIAFVVLDIEKRAVSVDCYKKGPGELVAEKFTTVSLSAGGSSGVCAITLDSDGTYEFFATASADGQSSNSKTVSLVLNTMIPGTPRNYNRNGGSCSVSFTTADDGGLTSRVVMYRSKNTEFVADNSTKVQEGNFGSNVDGVLTDPNENCGDYYYAIQSLSEGGIGSDFVGDEDVDTETRTRTRTIRNETIVRTGGAIPVTEGEITEGTEAGANGGIQEEGAVQGEETIGEVVEGAETEGQVAGAFSGKNKYWWIIGLIAILTAIYYGYQKSKRKNRIPLDEE